MLAFPDSLQAIVAARLDALDPEHKGLLQDAAVVGNVFWSGALGAMGCREAIERARALDELARKEIVRAAEHELDRGGRGIRLLAHSRPRRRL